MRALPFGLAVLLATTAVHARPIPRYSELVLGRAPKSTPLLPMPLSAPLYSSTKVLAIDTVLDVVPETGALTGHVDLTLEALSQVGTVSLLLDSGLAASVATAAGKTVSVTNQAAQSYALVTLDVSPALAAGEKVTLAVDYAGTLECKAQGCHKGKPLAFLSENGAIPGVWDQDSVGGYDAWGASRSLQISVPDGVDVVASGDRVSLTSAGGKATSVWKIPGYHSYGGNIVMLGALASKPVTGASLPTDVFTSASQPSFENEFASWMQTILPFIDEQSGQKLPYAGLKVFKLPTGWLDIFRGTAGHGLTLLSEDYASGGNGYFEETLAHENAHQWWGVLVSPTDILTSMWLVEGLATFSQIEYAAKVQHAAIPREEYLARRYREHWLLVKYMGDASLPLVLPSSQSVPNDSIGHTIWAYIRGSAVLEYLRVVVGDDGFAKLLRAWAKDCAQKLCDTGDFLTLLEQMSGEEFDPVFAQWVYGGGAPEPRLAFSQAAGKLTVTASGIDGLTLPLELWLTLEDGSLKKHRVRFEGSQPIELAESAPVRRVRPNPRQEGLVWGRSALDGDRDFDGEVDGLDVIECARQVGKLAQPSQPNGEGVWSMDLDFDPRCDADQDGSITDADLAAVTQAFGTVKGGGS